MIWYIPAAGGDFRLAACEGGATLTAHDPTEPEWGQMQAFLSTARERSWAVQGTLERRGKSSLQIQGPFPEMAGALLGKAFQGDRALLTAVRSEEGELLAVFDDRARPLAESAAQAAKAAPEGSEAVTVRRGTLCCPNPLPSPESRASRVLARFSSIPQIRSWREHGYLDCVGNLTGCTYRVFSRTHPRAVQQGQPIRNLDRDHILHRWDWRVPPAEEALASKLILEHREDWLLNASGSLAGSYPWVNTWGSDTHDGRYDAILFTFFGILAEEGPAILRGEGEVLLPLLGKLLESDIPTLGLQTELEANPGALRAYLARRSEIWERPEMEGASTSAERLRALLRSRYL